MSCLFLLSSLETLRRRVKYLNFVDQKLPKFSFSLNIVTMLVDALKNPIFRKYIGNLVVHV